MPDQRDFSPQPITTSGWQTTPNCARPPDGVDLAKAAVAPTLNLMNNEQGETPPPVPNKVVKAAYLLKKLEENGHRQDAAHGHSTN